MIKVILQFSRKGMIHLTDSAEIAAILPEKDKVGLYNTKYANTNSRWPEDFNKQ